MSKVKTGLILFLSGLAIYLASQLWFANTSSRNFFYSFFSHAESYETDNGKVFVKPYRLIINYSNNKFRILYSGIESNKLRESCDSIIQSMLKDGEHLWTNELNYIEVLGGANYIYEYAFDMPTTVFASAFNKSGFTDQLSIISSIAFAPPDAIRDTTIVWLLDEADMLMSCYSVKGSMPVITTTPDEFIQEVLYESSILSSYEFTDKNLFIAREMKEYYKYPSVSIVNPYAENELLMGVIEKRINTFFENPSAKLGYMSDNNVYTFVDANTVVEYYQNDVLEYSNYRKGDGDTGLLNNFGVAISFIHSDALVINEFYLAGYEQIDKGYTFYFDYVVNNYPMILPDEYKRETQPSGSATIKHALEVTVREGSVVNYKKIVYNFITDITDKTAKLDFEQVLAEASSSNYENQGKISNVILGYKLDRNKKAYLYWIIRIDDQSLSKIG